MHTSKRGVSLAALAVGSALALLVLSPPAAANISGPCTASINGVNVAGLGTGAASDAVLVKEKSKATVTMAAASAISHLKIQIEFAGFRWTVKNEPTTGKSWSRAVNVDDYATYGVGLYKVSGASTGAGLACSGAALVKVEGNPLTTVAGGVGLAATILGALGLAVSGLFALTGRAPLLGIVLGTVAGLLAGLGVGVLLQQYAVLYPTRAVAIAELAIGLGLGVTLPALGKLVSARRA
jgi:hypothetical protein